MVALVGLIMMLPRRISRKKIGLGLIVITIVTATAFFIFSARNFHYSNAAYIEEIFKDFTFDFENVTPIVDSENARPTYSKETNFNVFDTLTRHGYLPMPVSINAVKHHCTENGTLVPCSHRNGENGCGSSRTFDEESQTLIVPNIVHYTFFESNSFNEFTFLHYLSFRSVDRFIKPDQIFFYGDIIPSSHWWQVTISEVKNIYYVEVPGNKSAPSGKQFKALAHRSDVVRLEILLLCGGIYLDMDVLIVKSFDPLRKYQTVLSIELPTRMNNGIIVARSGAPFLQLMYEQYRSYAGPSELYVRKSVENPFILAGIYPHLIHVEVGSMHIGNKSDFDLLHSGHYNWSHNYALHLFSTQWPTILNGSDVDRRPKRVEDVLRTDTTIGEISRYILFCSSNISRYRKIKSLIKINQPIATEMSTPHYGRVLRGGK